MGGKVVAGLIGGLGLGITAATLPFVSPGLRRICLPFVPATDTQIGNLRTAILSSVRRPPASRAIDLGSGDGRVFGEQLSTHLTPEWRKQYIEYNKLKSIIYSAMESTPNTDGEENARYLAKVDEAFFAACQEELVKVNLFFGQKLAEAQGKFFELTHDLEQYKAQGRSKGEKRSIMSPLRLVDKTHRESGKTAHQLKLAFSEYYLGLVLLQNFQQLNATGFRKILKKRDKLIGNTKGLEWRQNTVEKAAFFLTREIDSLINKTENAVINDLEGGDRSGGMKRLRVPPLSEVQSAWTTYRLGFFCGAFLILLGMVLLKNQQGLGSNGQPKWVGVRLFRGFLLLFVNLLLLGLNMYGWQKAGVNHVLIFEMDPRQHLTYQSVMETATFFAMIWALAVLGFLFAPTLNCSPLLFPLLLTLFLTLWMLNPFNFPDFTHRSSRMWLIRHFLNCLTAPLHFVTFADFWLADQMNSFVTFFLDMEYLVCFYSTEVHYNLTTFEITAIPQPFPNSTIGINYETGEDLCSSNLFGIRPIVSLIPAFIRFMQCLRRYRDTKKKHPHLSNAGKYFSSFFVIIIGSLNTLWYHEVSSWQSPLFYPWLGAYLVSFCYAFTWDIKMDWGLLEHSANNAFLRDELVYDSPYYYYAAIAGDFVMRLGWVLNLSLGDAWTIEAETLLCITAPMECFRRFVWNYFRLENEHLNNCGQFRAVRDISVKPMRTGDVDELLVVMDSPDGVSHRGTAVAAAGLRKRRKKGKGGLWRAADLSQLTMRGRKWVHSSPPHPNIPNFVYTETAPGRLVSVAIPSSIALSSIAVPLSSSSQHRPREL